MSIKELAWSDTYRLGISNIDKQHQKLFDIVGEIFSLKDHDDVKEEIRTILYELHEYIQIHFRDEEAYMKEIEYPELAHHQALHEKIVENVAAITKNSDRLDILQTKMRVIAKRALVDHILNEDMKIKAYQKNKKRSKDVVDEPIISLEGV
jgi:hemerythrin